MANTGNDLTVRPSPKAVEPMRICLFSYTYLPNVGGLQNVSLSLGAGCTALGHQVTLVTCTLPPPDQPEYDQQFSFRVVRLSTGVEAWRQWGAVLAETDLVVSNGMSLTYWWLWKLRRKPIIYVHQLFLGIQPGDHGAGFIESARRWLRLAVRRWFLRRSSGNVYISRMIEEKVGGPRGVIIYNPIEAGFRPLPQQPVETDFAYFGRMVGEKGVTDLLDALQLCREKGHRFTCALYGEGTELPSFQRHAARLDLGGLIHWHPFASGESLVQAMNSATVIVVPSKWDEPMGIVAVEAMACGKCVIGSSGGGLGEVLEGVCPTYPNHDVPELARQMIKTMCDPTFRSGCEQAALQRAADFERGKILRQYLQYFDECSAGA